MSHSIKTSENVTWISNSDASGDIEINTLVTEYGNAILTLEDIKQYSKNKETK